MSLRLVRRGDGAVTADAFGARHLGVNFGIMFLIVAVAIAGYLARGRRHAAIDSRPS